MSYEYWTMEGRMKIFKSLNNNNNITKNPVMLRMKTTCKLLGIKKYETVDDKAQGSETSKKKIEKI